MRATWCSTTRSGGRVRVARVRNVKSRTFVDRRELGMRVRNRPQLAPVDGFQPITLVPSDMIGEMKPKMLPSGSIR